MKKILYLSILAGIKIFSQTGINTASPTNMLHVKGTGVSDVLRIEGLATNNSNLDNLVSTSTGVIKRQNLNTVSAVRASGTLDMASNNSFYFLNATSPSIEEFDNLNEFNGGNFIASRSGLYFVSYTVTFPQRPSTSDGGDGYTANIGFYFPQGYESSSTKIFTPESGLNAATQSVNVKCITKLKAGNNIFFQILLYGSSGNVNGVTYKVNIVRID